jgi:hypothetical protein
METRGPQFKIGVIAKATGFGTSEAELMIMLILINTQYIP